MTPETGLRLLAAAGATAVGRTGERVPVATAGLLAGLAAFGWSPRPLPAALAAGLSILVLTALATVALLPRRLPITGDGALTGVLFGLPAAAVAAVACRIEGAWGALAAAAVVLAAVSLFSAVSVRAAADSGGRRMALMVSALLLPAVLAAAVSGLSGEAPGRRAAPLLVAVGIGAFAWMPVIVAERGRVRRELEEEVRLGFLPAEDAAVLELPWRRCFEKRFGRPDERREYVRSALLLAVARAQQRRRTGEAERLRQLEVLTFRTRLRRTLEARALRDRRHDSLEVPIVRP